MPKNVISQQDVIFGIERSRRPSLFDTNMKNEIVDTQASEETVIKVRRRSATLNAPIMNNFKRLMSFDKPILPVLEGNEVSTMDLQLFAPPHQLSNEASTADLLPRFAMSSNTIPMPDMPTEMIPLRTERYL